MTAKTTCDAAAILAGGASRRMGATKALLPLGGEPLVRITAGLLVGAFAEVVVVTADAAIAAAAGLPAVPDSVLGAGPLAGIGAALHHFNAPVFVVACDMPYLDGDFIAHMKTTFAAQPGFDALVPKSGDFCEPLHAIYAPSALNLIDSELRRERQRPLQQIVRQLNARYLDESEARRFEPDLRMFANWNSPGDIDAAPDAANLRSTP